MSAAIAPVGNRTMSGRPPIATALAQLLAQRAASRGGDPQARHDAETLMSQMPMWLGPSGPVMPARSSTR